MTGKKMNMMLMLISHWIEYQIRMTQQENQMKTIKRKGAGAGSHKAIIEGD